MKIVISGPFGRGSLSDEVVLAGLLTRLGASHEITILSADPQRVAAAHPNGALKMVELENPGSLLSTREAWSAIAKCHVLILASAGTISDAGNPPSRVWLSQLEHGKVAGVKTALVGAGARAVPDVRERARIQRFLHNYTDCLSVRDEESKEVVCGYGMSPSRVSNNGGPALALGLSPVKSTPRPGRIGIVLSSRVPSRDAFGYEAAHFSGRVADPVKALASALLEDTSNTLALFHDDTPEAEEFVRALRPDAESDRISALSSAESVETIRERVAECEVVFSCSLQGLVLAATCGAPAVGLAQETGARDFLRLLLPGVNAGETWALLAAENGEAFDAPSAAKRIADARAGAPGLRETIAARVKALLKKEAQNGRMLELLVPRRDRREDRSAGGEDSDLDENFEERITAKPQRKGAPRAGVRGAPRRR